MASKWKALLKDLNLEREPLRENADEVLAAKAEFLPHLADPSILTTIYQRLRNEKDVLDHTAHRMNLRIRALEQMLIESYEAANVDKITLADGSSVSTEYEPCASAEDPVQVRAWAVSRGLGDKLGLPWPTLNSEVKEMLLNGEAPPPGVRLFMRVKVTSRGR